MEKTIKGSIGYGFKFSELGLTTHFEYLGLTESHHMIKVKCKDCGSEFTRNDDILRCRSYTLRCRDCGAVVKVTNEERERVKKENEEKKRQQKERLEKTVICLYSSGLSVRQIAISTNYQEAYIRKVLRSAGIVVTISRTTYVNQKRKAEATERYKAKFSELGQSGFEYIEFARKDSHVFRCNRCGAELRRGSDIFKGKQKKLICRNCGNGSITYSPFVDEVLEYYSQKHSIQETCEKFNLEKWQLNEWTKRRHVSNGRTISEINKEKALISAQKTREKCENQLAVDLLQHGFGYLEGYKNGNSTIKLTHFECGAIFERRADYFRKYGYSCPACEAVKAEERRAERQRIKDEERKEKQKAREQQKALRELLNPLGLSPYQLEREKRLEEKSICKVCGKTYTLRDYVEENDLKYAQNPGYCSAECRKLAKKAKEKERRKLRAPDNHRARARKFGCEYETGITLKKLVARDGLTCALCGELCDWNDRDYSKYCGPLYPSIDHIIPMAKGGGHTWANVQVAHIICNSKKAASLDYGGQ